MCLKLSGPTAIMPRPVSAVACVTISAVTGTMLSVVIFIACVSAAFCARQMALRSLAVRPIREAVELRDRIGDR